MKINMKKTIVLSMVFNLFVAIAVAQNSYIISGKVIETTSGKPLPNATVHLKGSNFSSLTKMDGSFKFSTANWYDTLEITNVGYEIFTIGLQKEQTTNLSLSMINKSGSLTEVIIGSAKKPGKAFMQKVIDHRANNNPMRFSSYSYQRYTRCELDVDNIDFEKANGNGIKSMMIKAYANTDSSAKNDKELPIYFAEKLANIYHAVSPSIDRENIIAKKNLGLKTDNLLSKLDKYYFNFNVYEDWIPIFDQTYVSPLNANAFSYYKFTEGDTMVDNDEVYQMIQFKPLRSYERAFSGSLWINTKSFAVQYVNMHLTKTANLNFINDINYVEEYKQQFDSASNQFLFMPYKFSSDVKFESGLALLGIPVPENKNAVKFIMKNTTVTDRLILNANEPSNVVANLIKKEQTTNWDKSDAFWQSNRPEDLTIHEKNIYAMVDSLKVNKRFQRDIKLVAFAGSGYWDFGRNIRVGPYSSFLSTNSIEGLRIRLGFWTMPGISKNINLFGYGAYGTKDQKLKGLLGVKYIWNAARWTKTTLSYGSDYDFLIDQDDELDKDNLINSLLRKNIPFTRTYTKAATIKHEQYLSTNWSAKGSITYKELNPVFDFKYKAINPLLDKPYDSVFATKLPVAEASIGIRYAHKERTTILNYDNIRIRTFYPVFTANYTYGFEQGNALFNFHKVNVGIEQFLRLPPKSMLYYKLEVGKVYGTIPYLLLNIPAGNEYYVASKYQFNTMTPYEFAADKYVSLHTRFYLGGVLFDKIPFIRKLGWRERFSYNSYLGSMDAANTEYNKNSNFNVVGKVPFMEASVGIENIFHVLSLEYYRRLNYLNNPYAKKDGVYVGLTLSF